MIAAKGLILSLSQSNLFKYNKKEKNNTIFIYYRKNMNKGYHTGRWSIAHGICNPATGK